MKEGPHWFLQVVLPEVIGHERVLDVAVKHGDKAIGIRRHCKHKLVRPQVVCCL